MNNEKEHELKPHVEDGSTNGGSASPPGSATHLQIPGAAQYATYPDPTGARPGGARLMSYASSGKALSDDPLRERAWAAGHPADAHPFTPWVPIPLRTWFWVPLVGLMAGGGIAFEVALHFSERDGGWATKGEQSATAGFVHYAYTFPPVAISMFFAGMWAWTDIEIRRLQPYVDLAQGDAPPQRSLLLDYTRTHTAYVWTIAARNRHWLVSLASLLVLVTFCFQPLAAALFNVQDVFRADPRSTATNLAVIGLNQDQNFQDLTSFLTAAGYASANVLYDIGDPTFVHGGYTIAPIALPDIANGTLVVNTTAVRSEPTCVGPSEAIAMTQGTNGSWTNVATFGDCVFSFEVNKTTQHLFGSNPIGDSTTGCASQLAVPPQFRSVLFWYFSYDTSPPLSAVSLCTPAISLWDVQATVDLASRNLTAVSVLGPLGSGNGTESSLARASGNLTGAPVSGRAYNGLFFNLTEQDQFTTAREAAVQLELPAAVFQAGVQAQGGLEGAFAEGLFSALSLSVYTNYLALVAKTVYFLPATDALAIETMTVHKRLFLSPVAVHLLAAAMFVLAVGGTVLHLWHRQERQVLALGDAPGTIASAVALGAQTGVGSVLAGQQRAEDMYAALRDKRFRIDVRTNRIVMQGEAGYEDAASPPAGRLAFGIPRSVSMRARRWSRGVWAPRSPRGVDEGGEDA